MQTCGKCWRRISASDTRADGRAALARLRCQHGVGTVMEGHGRPWKAVEGHGRPWKVLGALAHPWAASVERDCEVGHRLESSLVGAEMIVTGHLARARVRVRVRVRVRTPVWSERDDCHGSPGEGEG